MCYCCPKPHKYSPKQHRTKKSSPLNSHMLDMNAGSTGCGKTTQVPQYILDEAIEQNRRVSIVVTQPRRIAAFSVAKRVCEERGCGIGTHLSPLYFLFTSLRFALAARGSPNFSSCVWLLCLHY